MVRDDRSQFGPDRKPRVLIVDDSRLVRSVFYNTLSENYDCTVAGSYVEAVDFLKLFEFELVIADVIMPATARRMGVTDIYDPQQNIEGGVKYMRLLLDMFGDVNLALAGYNAGEGAVIKYGYQIPPYNETQDYVRRISARYRAIGTPILAQTTGRSRSE